MSRLGYQATAGRRPAATPILTREIHSYGLYRYISFRDVYMLSVTHTVQQAWPFEVSTDVGLMVRFCRV